jgi:hypothetical protein
LSGTASDIQAYRYDWIVGLSCVAEESRWWDWQATLRAEDALKVQLLIEPVPGITYSELSAELLALHPSRDTTSWFEESAGESLKTAGSIAKAGASVIPGLAFGAQILNAIPSKLDKRQWFLGRRKNWFLYRYFDAMVGCPAVEWVVSKNVMRQYGPLLRGSLALAFHGEPGQSGECANLRLRAGLGLRQTTGLDYVLPGGEGEPLLGLLIGCKRE